MKSINIFYLFSLIFLFGACNLEQEIELELPEYDSQKVVECYLEPGQPFNLLLTRSSGYFDEFGTLDDDFLENTLEEGAEISIKYGVETIVLENELTFDFLTGKIYNYNSESLVPMDFDTEFSLEITTSTGELITAQTRIIPQTPIDSLVIEFEPNTMVDTAARVLTYATDDVNNANYYRRILSTGANEVVDQDFVVNDELLESALSVFGTGYDFNPGDTVTATFIQISEEYYRFKNSVDGSVDSNGNPFGQPGVIVSNVEGEADPIGIFTGFVRDRKQVIIPE